MAPAFRRSDPQATDRTLRAGARGAFVSLGMLVTLAPAMATSRCRDDAEPGSLLPDGLDRAAVVFETSPPSTEPRARAGDAEAHGEPERGASPLQAIDDPRPFHEVSFAATHNSYAGSLSDGNVTSIRTQLDMGVRFLELDVHDDEYAEHGYRVGHEHPGDLVYHGEGNPAADDFGDWLGLVAAWSDEHPAHAPITLCLDFKDSLADNESFEDGNLDALNRLLEATFKDKLFTAAERETRPWPSVSDLRGRILAVLSGDEETRIAYRGDHGHSPAVTLNDSGKVIEVHGSDDDELWYWTGAFSPSGQVIWKRHGFYDTGNDPSIDVNNRGLVIEAHEDPDAWDDTLWYRVGRLGSDFEITWLLAGALPFPDGARGHDPVVRFVDRDKDEVEVVHRAPWSRMGLARRGSFDASRASLVWSAAARTVGAPSPDKSIASTGSTTVEVFTDDSAFGRDTILFSTHRAGPNRIRLRQVAFVEYQHDSPSQLANDGLLFYAGPAGEAAARTWATAWRAAGKVSRLWRFNDARWTRESAVNFPATDLPLSRWYGGYRAALDFVR